MNDPTSAIVTFSNRSVNQLSNLPTLLKTNLNCWNYPSKSVLALFSRDNFVYCLTRNEIRVLKFEFLTVTFKSKEESQAKPPFRLKEHMAFSLSHYEKGEFETDEVDRRICQKRIPIAQACDSGILFAGGYISGAVSSIKIEDSFLG